jgi:hypothetical protein
MIVYYGGIFVLLKLKYNMWHPLIFCFILQIIEGEVVQCTFHSPSNVK